MPQKDTSADGKMKRAMLNPRMQQANMRWSRAYNDRDNVPSESRDGLVWWSPPVESFSQATVDEQDHALSAKLRTSSDGSVELRIEWLDASLPELVADESCSCACLTDWEGSPPHEYEALLTRALVKAPWDSQEMRQRASNVTVSSTWVGWNCGQRCVNESICDWCFVHGWVATNFM